jgi:hypothetical protein
MAGEASFTPEVADYIAIRRANLIRSLKTPSFRVRMTVICLIFLGIGIGIGWWAPDLSAKVQIIASMIGAFALWMGTILGLSFLLVPRRAKRLFQQHRSLHRPFSFGWSDAGISVRTNITVSELTWSDYHGWLEARDVFLFMLNEELVHFAPKRALTPIQITDLRETTVRNCPQRR